MIGEVPQSKDPRNVGGPSVGGKLVDDIGIDEGATKFSSAKM